MKKIVTFLAVLMMMVLPACKAPAALVDEPVDVIATEAPVMSETEVVSEPEPEVTQEVEPAAEVTPQVTVDFAKNFTLEYKDGYRLLTVTTPWMGATEPIVYALVPTGTEVSDDLGEAVVIHTPIESIVTLSTTYLPFLDQIGMLSSLVAVDTPDYIFNPEVRTWAEGGMIASVGSGPSINVEGLIELDPDLIMTSASGSPEWDTHPALEKAGLPVVINADYLEQNPLGRAEWGKFIAAFYDKEAEAAELFDALVERYNEAKALTVDITEKKTVLINTAYEGTWYMPGKDSFAAVLIRDAGGDYLWNDLEGSGAQPIDFEAVVERAKDADVWINQGFAFDLAGLAGMDSRYADFNAYQEGEVYNNNLRVTEMGGTDYYEGAVANPDVVLMDLIKAFYPDLLPDHEFFYYQKLQ